MVVNKDFLLTIRGESQSLSNFGANNFNIKEFECKCRYKFCVYNFIDLELVKLLQKVRTWSGNIIKINSAYRCGYYNSKIRNSASHSRHMAGQAADIASHYVSSEDIYDYINDELNHQGGLGIYNNFVHVDVRGKYSRWDNRSN